MLFRLYKFNLIPCVTSYIDVSSTYPTLYFVLIIQINTQSSLYYIMNIYDYFIVLMIELLYLNKWSTFEL